MERTLSIIKPDGVEKGFIGEVIGRIEKAGFKIIKMKMIRMTKREAEGFYQVHRKKSFFEGLIEFMSSGPSVVMVLEKEGVIEKYRELMGATDPKGAAKGTIRRDFASDNQKNIVHGSDSPESALMEISYFFSALELT